MKKLNKRIFDKIEIISLFKLKKNKLKELFDLIISKKNVQTAVISRALSRSPCLIYVQKAVKSRVLSRSPCFLLVYFYNIDLSSSVIVQLSSNKCKNTKMFFFTFNKELRLFGIVQGFCGHDLFAKLNHVTYNNQKSMSFWHHKVVQIEYRLMLANPTDKQKKRQTKTICKHRDENRILLVISLQTGYFWNLELPLRRYVNVSRMSNYGIQIGSDWPQIGQIWDI